MLHPIFITFSANPHPTPSTHNHKIKLFISTQSRMIFINQIHYNQIMIIIFLTYLIRTTTASSYKDEEIKTSITNPLFLARLPTSEGVAIANQYIVQIYLRERLNNHNFNIPYHNSHISRNIITTIPTSQPLDSTDLQKILQKLQVNEKISKNNQPVYSYHLKKHIIMDTPISGLYWQQKFFIIKTSSTLHIYTNELAFIMSYPLKQKLLAMTAIDFNIYLLFDDPTNISRLNQATLTFNQTNLSKQTSFSIQIPQSYKIYEYFMNDYEWLYLVNETHVSVYDILNKKIKNTIQSKFQHAITTFKVDQTDSLAIASNQYGDYLFISFNHVLLTIKNTNYTYAAFCSNQYLVLGNTHAFQVMQVDDDNNKYLSSIQQFETENIQAIQCSFTSELSIIYTIDDSGYLDIYYDTKAKWGMLAVIIIIIFAVLILAKFMGDSTSKEFEEFQKQQKLLNRNG